MEKIKDKSSSYDKSDASTGNRTLRPILASGIGRRIAAVADALKTRRNAAHVADVSVDSLQRYIRDDNMPPFDVAARLCLAANVRMEWLATGEGEMLLTDSQSASDGASQLMRLDPETLASSIAAVDAGLDVLDVTMPAADKARLVVVVYRRLVARQLQPAELVATVLQSIKSAVNR